MNVLCDAQVERFVEDGFVHLEQAFPGDVAAACVDELWLLSGVDRDDRRMWTEPVVRVGGSGAAPLVTAINTERLCGAVDQLVGARRWQRRQGYGTFPIRFPSEHDPGDTGWHIDGSFEIGTADPPWNYGVNLWSDQRALLVLMLFSDVGMADAPTRIRVGSHLDVAPLLVPYGEAGVSFADVPAGEATADRPVAHATGRAGDAYLCHPFLVHAASWPHRGADPRFIGQPCIAHAEARDGFDYDRDGGQHSPCERAVRRALGPMSSRVARAPARWGRLGG